MQSIVLRTSRLVLTPLTRADEGDHAQASERPADAARDARSSELHWQERGFGPWAIRDRKDDSFLGCAELHYAGDGIDGIAPGEVEAGWWVTEGRRGEGIATEAMRAAIGDVWDRAGIDNLAAYIAGENEPSRRLAASLGFTVRGPGRGRFGEPMTVYDLRRS